MLKRVNSIPNLINSYPKISLLIIGGLYALAFSPFYFFILFPILILYFKLLETAKSKKQVFWYGVLFYGAVNAIWCVWILNVGKYIGPILILGYILLAIIMGLFGGVISVFTKKFGIEYFPIISTAVEYFRQFGWWKFPWMFAGYVAGFHPVAMQTVDIFGIHGLSLVVLYILVGIYFFIKNRNKLWLYTSVALTLFVVVYGVVRYNTNFIKDNKTKIAVLQGSIPQNLKWESNYKDSTYKFYNDLIFKVKKENPKIYFWPETAIPAWFNKSFSDKMKMIKIARETKAYHIFGSLRLKGNNKSNFKFFNSIYEITPQGDIPRYYDKLLLVPFGEYMPFASIFPLINQVNLGGSNFSFGESLKPINVGNLDIGNFICYEILFPYYVRKQVRDGANILFTGSNDGWFEFIEPYQHFEMALFRAIENRRYLIRSGNIGISGIVDEKGNVVKIIDLKKRDVVVGDVFSLKYKTIYYYIGDLIVFIAIGVMVVLIFIRRKKRSE